MPQTQRIQRGVPDRQGGVGGVQPTDDLDIVHPTVGEHRERPLELGQRPGRTEESGRHRQGLVRTDPVSEQLAIGDVPAHP